MIVYYYTPYCSYCQVSAYIFLSVAHMLRNFSQVTFARIDGENNDLPWYLIPQSYPTIILFPAKRYCIKYFILFIFFLSKLYSDVCIYTFYLCRKSESVVFPPSRELTVENLLDFVLSNVDVEIKLSYMIAKCDKYKHMVSDNEGKKCYCVQKSNWCFPKHIQCNFVYLNRWGRQI